MKDKMKMSFKTVCTAVLLLFASLHGVYASVFYEGRTLVPFVCFVDSDEDGDDWPKDRDVSEENLPGTRSIVMPVYAYVEDEVLSIQFDASLGGATLTVSNESTGEVFCEFTVYGPGTERLSLASASGGCYRIAIETSDAVYVGTFEKE